MNAKRMQPGATQDLDSGAYGPDRQTGNQSQEQKTFRCKDVGFEDCNWETSGRSENEMMPQIEKHGREKHNIQNIDDQTRNKIRENIRDRAA
jgi:predicted small metal-binding protein